MTMYIIIPEPTPLPFVAIVYAMKRFHLAATKENKAIITTTTFGKAKLLAHNQCIEKTNIHS